MRLLQLAVFLCTGTILIAQKPTVGILPYYHQSQTSISEDHSERRNTPGIMRDQTYVMDFQVYPSKRWILHGGIGVGQRSADMTIRRTSSEGSTGFGLFQLLVGSATGDPGTIFNGLENITQSGTTTSIYQLQYTGRLWEFSLGAEGVIIGAVDERFYTSLSMTLRRTKMSKMEINSEGVWNNYKLERELTKAENRVDVGAHFYLRPIADAPFLINMSLYMASIEKENGPFFKRKGRIGLRLGLVAQF